MAVLESVPSRHAWRCDDCIVSRSDISMGMRVTRLRRKRPWWSMTGCSSVNVAILDDELLLGLVSDDAHLADEVIKHDTDLPDSPSLWDALAGPKWDSWHAAVLEELATIRDTRTWTLVNHTPDICNIVGCHFVLQKKCGTDGKVTQFKACLIAQGFSQWEGINYSETFAPVVKSASLHVFLAICAHHGWHIRQMDIKSAYLNGVLSEDIYMWQPKGYEEKGSEEKIAKLQKGLYGLKQAGREWYATLPDFLVQLGFHQTHADHSVFIFEQGSSIVIIPVYVDDKLLAGNNEAMLNSIQNAIGSCFKTSDLGEASWILGICIRHNITTGTLFIDQAQYIKNVLSRCKWEKHTLLVSLCLPVY